MGKIKELRIPFDDVKKLLQGKKANLGSEDKKIPLSILEAKGIKTENIVSIKGTTDGLTYVIKYEVKK